jgi:putative transposase
LIAPRRVPPPSSNPLKESKGGWRTLSNSPFFDRCEDTTFIDTREVINKRACGCRTLWSLRVRGLTFMRIPLRRFYGRGDLHFVTFSCCRRRPYLGTVRARNEFVRLLDAVRADYGFRLFGYVVMPEHVHVLMSEPRKGTPSTVLQVLKQKVSRRLIADEESAPAFWQRRFYDFNVWSAKKVMEKLEYMHENPVKRRLVLQADDWPWSSWSHYARRERGLIEIDALEKRSTGENPHP